MSVERLRRVLEKHLSEGQGFVDITVFVKPGERETKLVVEGDDLVFYTTELDVAGRLNADLVLYIARLLNKPTSRVEVVYGVRDTTKRVRVYDVRLEEVMDRLLEHLSGGSS